MPVYELGTFTDRRPYFTMKLVKGRTLSSSSAPGHKQPMTGRGCSRSSRRSAQTMAYAHSRGVIHRDLKPSNVMVGSFGEVQVMDWGLAKVLPRGERGHDHPGAVHEHVVPVSVIQTARSGSDADASEAGSVLGTPGYMAPEQARGEIDALDERADVFGLGSILCEILTGAPAFVGRSSDEALRKAGRGDLADAYARLETCGAETELIALAKDCLTPERDDRLQNAGLVSERINAYQTGVQERLRRSSWRKLRPRPAPRKKRSAASWPTA